MLKNDRNQSQFVLSSLLNRFGCNAGFWCLEAHRSGATHVLGLDVRGEHIHRAKMVRDAMGISQTQVEYREMNIYDISRDALGEFDVCLLLRVLHHLNNPALRLE